jgi:magnesium chelatase subunit D
MSFAFLPSTRNMFSRPRRQVAVHAVLNEVDQEMLGSSAHVAATCIDETHHAPSSEFLQPTIVPAQAGAENLVAFPDSEFLQQEPAVRQGAEFLFKKTPQPLSEELNARSFPLSMIVGQDLIKQGLLMSAVNPQIRSIVISGGRGTGKSVMARAIHQLLPPIEVIKGSPFNIDPKGEFGLDDYTRECLERNGAMPLEKRETQMIPCPFVQVPLNVMEDRLIGSTDIEESVKLGKTVFSPGLLARAHRGVLYVDDINLLDEEIINILLNVITEGYVTVEREGVSLRYPCRPLLIATFNPEEGELRDCLLDSIAISVSADAHKLNVQERVEACERCMDFSGSGPQNSIKGEQALEDAIRLENEIKSSIILARENIKDIALSKPQMLYLCEEAIRAGCEGHRAEIFAVEVARANAALKGRQVTSEDLRLAVRLAIAPRGTFFQMPNTPLPPPPPPPMPPQLDEQNKDQDNNEEEEEEERDEPDRDEASGLDVPPQFMFDVDATPMDPDLIEFSNRQKKGKGGGRGLIFSQDRGRYIKPMLPKGKVVRLAGKTASFVLVGWNFYFSFVYCAWRDPHTVNLFRVWSQYL